MFGSGRAATLGFKGLAKKLRTLEDVDLFVVEAEPWSLLRWQSRIFAFCNHRRAKFIDFTWENIPRVGWRGHLLGLIYRLAGLTSDGVIAGNLGAKRLLVKNGFAEEKVSLSPQFGIEPTDFPLRQLEEKRALRASLDIPIQNDDILIGFCGRLVESKGIKDLFAATEALLETGLKGIKLVMMGPGDPLKVLALDELPAWCFHLPPGTHQQVPKFMGSLDYLVLASKTEYRPGSLKPIWEEQFGRVLIEGMASGAVVLGARSGAIPEVLGEEAIFEPSDSKSLFKLLKKYIENEAERDLIISKQSRDFRTRFTMQKVAEGWADILRKVCGFSS